MELKVNLPSFCLSFYKEGQSYWYSIDPADSFE